MTSHYTLHDCKISMSSEVDIKLTVENISVNEQLAQALSH